VLNSILKTDFQIELRRELSDLKQKVSWHVSGIPQKIERDSLYVIGPNVDLNKIPKETLKIIIGSPSIFITPSDWVNPILAHEHGIPPIKIKSWPVGLDDKEFKDDEKIKSVIIYEKNRTLERLETSEKEILGQALSELGYQFKYFQYGKYLQPEFLTALRKAEFAIWLGETESQGIALLQAWLSGTPTLCRHVDTYVQKGTRYDASSAPYLQDVFGGYFFGRIPSKAQIEEFALALSNEECRKLAIETFSLASSAKEIVKIINSLT
jgi:hypothetical protein